MERLNQSADDAIFYCAICGDEPASVHDNGKPKCSGCALVAFNGRIAALEASIANLRESA